ncbi:uncharacterized protein [Malus domestica]|uniref:uncharacterized protein n=1 Tax=Malus domestica TaxID=3750 RepID=UPI00397656F0
MSSGKTFPQTQAVQSLWNRSAQDRQNNPSSPQLNNFRDFSSSFCALGFKRDAKEKEREEFKSNRLQSRILCIGIQEGCERKRKRRIQEQQAAKQKHCNARQTPQNCKSAMLIIDN